MKKNRTVVRYICLLLCLQLFCLPVLATTATDNPVLDGSGIDSVETPLLGAEQKIENCISAFLYEVESETVMYAWNPDEQLDPASLAKIMTALLAVESGNMLDMVTVEEEVIATVPSDAVSAHLKAGEVLYLQDLLYCLLVGSANDAAAVIADHLGGSQDAFVQMMNDRAQELGCTGTFFKNPHGLYDAEQKITARDAARILAAAMKNELFATVIGTVEHTVPATTVSEARLLRTGNYLMSQAEVEIHYDERIVGSRTGVAGDGTRCIASVAESNGLQLICVVMGAKSEFKEDGYTVKIFGGYPETKQLLDLCFGSYQRVQLLYADQALRQCTVVGGDSDVIVGSSTSKKTVLPADVTQDQLTYRFEDIPEALTAPVQKGTHVSNLEIWYGNICVAETKLFAMNSVAVAETQPIEELPDPNRGEPVKTALMIVGGVVLAVVAVFVVIILVNRVRAALLRKRVRQRRRNRRRSR